MMLWKSGIAISCLPFVSYANVTVHQTLAAASARL
jgi:hypothetical protein